jgi:hypothetical protein
VDGSQEVPRGLLVSGGDGTKLLDLSEEVLDQMARRIKLSDRSRGDDRLDRGGITAVLPAAASGSRTRASASNALSAMSVSASIVIGHRGDDRDPVGCGPTPL